MAMVRTENAPAGIPNSVDVVLKSLNLSAQEVADIVGATPRSIRRWAAGEAVPQRPAKLRLLELVAVGNALTGVIRPEDTNLWIFTPTPLLDYEKPADLIARGEWRRVIAVIEGLADGVFV